MFGGGFLAWGEDLIEAGPGERLNLAGLIVAGEGQSESMDSA